jgi:hypothetical protein
MEKLYVGRYYPGKDWAKEVEFCAEPRNWGTREAAETACRDLSAVSNIRTEMHGRTYLCQRFRVEEWEAGKFAVACDVVQ